MDQKAFNFNKFIEDSKVTLLNPKEYFTSMKTDGGMIEPIIKAFIYSVVAGIFGMLWSILHIGGIAGGFVGGATGIGAFFVIILSGIIGLFIGGIIILILSSICKGNADFEANVRVSASLMVIFPVSAFFNIFTGINFTLHAFINLAVNLYALYMLYIALSLTLKGKEETIKIIMYVFAGLLLLFFLIGIAGGRRIKKYGGFSERKVERYLKEYQNALEDVTGEVADYGKEVEKLASSAMKEPEVKDRIDRPAKFPEEALQNFKTQLSTSESKITKDKLYKLLIATEAIKPYDQSQSAEITEALNKSGFQGMQEYMSDYVSAVSGMAALGGLITLQEMMEGSEKEKKSAETFTFDKALEAVFIQSVKAGEITEKDLHTVYDNWELLVELEEKSNK